MFSDVDEMVKHLEVEAVEVVDLWLTDPLGRWRHITLPASSFTAPVASEGLGFDGSSIGFTSLEAGDLVIVPDSTTAFPDPFHSRRTLSVICDVAHADTRDAFPLDPRGIARRAEAQLRTSGVADTSHWGPELEFYVFKRVAVSNRPCSCASEVEPLDRLSSSLTTRAGQGYFAAPPADRLGRLRERICTELVAAGIPVKYHHHEVGRLGQVEIELPLGGLLEQADRIQVVKYFSRMCAEEAGVSITFMPKPLHEEAGSGMHFHQHLFHRGTPLFFDSGGYGGLSEIARRYTAGLLAHGRALSAFTNPSTNSYKRLIPGFEAPVKLYYSLANRSAAVRIPKYASRPEEKRIEYRPPDATCNPYLAMAAMLMAGIDGIERALEPEELGFGPFDEDVLRWPLERQKQLHGLPRTLDEAADALQSDHAFLESGGVFPTLFVDAWIRRILDGPCAQLAERPHPYEFELYYDC